MKLQKRLKGTSDVGSAARQKHQRFIGLRNAGIVSNGPDGPETADPMRKGKKDGNCNRAACQAPLKGRRQFWMTEMGKTNGRLYYCGRCEFEFSSWDARMVAKREQEPNGWSGALDHRGYRCRPDEDNDGIATRD